MDLKETPFLKIPILQPRVTMEKGNNGVIYIKSLDNLDPYPERLTERLIKWANEIPENTFIGQRDENEAWRRLTYGEAYAKVQAVGQYLLQKEVSTERPVIMMSSNTIEYAIMKLACMHIGIPFSPISPAYATKSKDYGKLKHCVELLTPGLIFVEDGKAFEKPLEVVANGVSVLAVNNVFTEYDSFNDALATSITSEVELAYSKVTSDSIAKILFTSGSTGKPKGVINTHGNMLHNAQQNVQTFPFMANGGFHIISWLPWNHTFGGNSDFGLTLFNGGSLHIDDGNPTPKGIQKTVRNLRDIAPTIFYNVPKGFEEILPYLKEDKELCSHIFSRLKMFFYAGASMPQHVWDGLEQLAYDTIGKRLFIATGLGMTEASPSALFNTEFNSVPGRLGVPVPELEVKLVPDEDKMEARFKGKNLTPGYWRNPEVTANAFDEEGFYKTGDAIKIIDMNDISKGMLFNGRIAENFKLASGTWVNVGQLRAKMIKEGNGLLVDAVITGHDRNYIGAIAIPEMNYCRNLAELPESASIKEVVQHSKVIEALKNVLKSLGLKSTGSSTHIKKTLFADFELSLDKGEITDKGSINQRAILRHRDYIVQKIYKEELNQNILQYQKEEKKSSIK